MDSARNGVITVYPLLARTVAPTVKEQINRFGIGLIIHINVTAVPTVETLTFTVQGKDPLSATFHTIIASAALVAAGMVVLKVYPGLTAAANLVVSDILPYNWRLLVTPSAAGSFTYSATATVVV